VLIVASGITGAGPAQAQLSSFTVSALPLFPTNVVVGAQNQAAAAVITHSSVGPIASQSAAVSSIRLNPSCNSSGILPCSAAEPRALAGLPILGVDSPASGRAGTACAGTLFTASAPDATGTITFTPSATVILGPASVGGPAASCIIDFTFDVAQRPLDGATVANLAVQASTPAPGQGGTPAAVTGVGGSSLLGVAPAPTTAVTQASSTVVAEGASVTATTMVTGVALGPPLTGNVVFRLYRTLAGFPECSAGQLVSTFPPVPVAPTSPDPVTGAPRATATSAPVALPAGNYVFVSSYDESDTDVSYGPSTTACAGATVTVINVPPVVSVFLDAAPLTRPAPGGTFTYMVTVHNDSPQEPVTIVSLTDGVFGDVATRGGSTCGAIIGSTLAPGATSAPCAFTG